MKVLEILSYLYFGCPKDWSGTTVSEKKRLMIKMVAALVCLILIISFGISFIISGASFHGVVLLCFAVAVYILLCRDFRKHKK